MSISYETFLKIILSLIAIIIAIILIYGIINGDLNVCHITYKLPDGTVCKHGHITTGSFGAATHEFYGCTNNRRYINPGYYEEINKCQ